MYYITPGAIGDIGFVIGYAGHCFDDVKRTHSEAIPFNEILTVDVIGLLVEEP